MEYAIRVNVQCSVESFDSFFFQPLITKSLGIKAVPLQRLESLWLPHHTGYIRELGHLKDLVDPVFDIRSLVSWGPQLLMNKPRGLIFFLIIDEVAVEQLLKLLQSYVTSHKLIQFFLVEAVNSNSILELYLIQHFHSNLIIIQI